MARKTGEAAFRLWIKILIKSNRAKVDEETRRQTRRGKTARRVKTFLASGLLLLALGLAYVRISNRREEIAVENAEAVEAGFRELDEVAELERIRNRALWAADEQRRIDSLGDQTFDANGRWIFADPNREETLKRQWHELGWDLDDVNKGGDHVP